MIWQRESGLKIRPREIIFFLLIWFLIAGGLFSALYFSGLMPAYAREFIDSAFSYDSASFDIVPAFSKESAAILISKIGLVSPIVFPESTDLEVLKKAANTGAVHYPDSVLPGENGNVFIFGHSSSRVFKKNPARTVFTNLHKLEIGDEIVVKSFKTKYYYRVSSVEIVDPKEARVYLKSDKPRLTLSTCWPVGNPENRTVVEAEFLRKTLVN